jgi:ATP-dependent Clp protease ATP-binding subunit ClpA
MDEIDRILAAAKDEAARLQSPVIGQEHVLLVIGEEPAAPGGRLLAAVEVDVTDLRQRLLLLIKPGRGGEPVATPRLERAVLEARAEATEHGRTPSSADLVLGILRCGEGMGALILGHFGVTLAKAREAAAA